MKNLTKKRIVVAHDGFAIVTLICLAGLPVCAEDALLDPDATPKPATASPAPSLTAHLQMQPDSAGKLDRLYAGYVSRRTKQETDIAAWQNELQRAQEPATFDEDKATQLLRAISSTRQAITADLLATRAKALEVLGPVQRSRLESLARDTRIRVRRDTYFYLLLLPVEQLWHAPLNVATVESTLMQEGSAKRTAKQPTPRQQPTRRQEKQQRQRRGSGSYGVYGGYGYGGPNYGVYGSYGEGPVGVHAGVGRGGPSVGVSVGGVFGGWRR